ARLQIAFRNDMGQPLAGHHGLGMTEGLLQLAFEHAGNPRAGRQLLADQYRLPSWSTTLEHKQASHALDVLAVVVLIHILHDVLGGDVEARREHDGGIQRCIGLEARVGAGATERGPLQVGTSKHIAPQHGDYNIYGIENIIAVDAERMVTGIAGGDDAAVGTDLGVEKKHAADNTLRSHGASDGHGTPPRRKRNWSTACRPEN